MKTKKIEGFLDRWARDNMGHSRKGHICVTCGARPDGFRDDCSRREWRISKMCQKCQDEFWRE